VCGALQVHERYGASPKKINPSPERKELMWNQLKQKNGVVNPEQISTGRFLEKA